MADICGMSVTDECRLACNRFFGATQVLTHNQVTQQTGGLSAASPTPSAIAIQIVLRGAALIPRTNPPIGHGFPVNAHRNIHPDRHITSQLASIHLEAAANMAKAASKVGLAVIRYSSPGKTENISRYAELPIQNRRTSLRKSHWWQIIGSRL